MGESIQHKLGRVRPPRVQITYDVEIGNAIEVKELPFVMGIMADLSGIQEEAPSLLKERKFIEIDRDNFNDIMTSIRPRLTMAVQNKLANDDSTMGAEIIFNDMEDFNPINVLKQIEPLRRLFEARTLLKDLLTKLDGNDKLDKLLEEVLLNTEKLEALKGELGVTDAPAGDAPAEGA